MRPSSGPDSPPFSLGSDRTHRRICHVSICPARASQPQGGCWVRIPIGAIVCVKHQTRQCLSGNPQKQEKTGRAGKVGYSREAAPVWSVILTWPVASRPGLSSASMFVPVRYLETRSQLVPSRGPLAAPIPHGGFLRPWFLGFEAPHPPPAAVVDSAWVPRRRDTPNVLLFFCSIGCFVLWFENFPCCYNQKIKL